MHYYQNEMFYPFILLFIIVSKCNHLISVIIPQYGVNNARGTFEMALFYFSGSSALFSIFIKQKMNFSSRSKHTPLRHISSNCQLLSYKPYYPFFNPPSSKMILSTPSSQTREGRFKSSDYKNFKQKQDINEENQLSCFTLISLPQSNPFITISDLNKIDFSALSYSIKELTVYSKTIIDSSPQRRIVGKSFNLLRLIELIAENYNTTAYHNFTHAFSVLQLVYQCYNRSEELRKGLTEKQWFYVFIAALAHDLNHPGTNNAFQVKTKSIYAQEAGNESVLQKMHLTTLWSILKKNSQVNFLQGYSSYQSLEIKKLVTRMILATDVARHFKGLDVLKQFVKSKKKLQGENSIFLVEQLFHACDIGNPCLNFDNYLNWAALVSHQFDQIALREQRMGVEVTGYLKYSNVKKFYEGQVGFCNGLVLPLWRELSIVLPGLQEMRENISQNIKELEKRKNSLSY